MGIQSLWLLFLLSWTFPVFHAQAQDTPATSPSPELPEEVITAPVIIDGVQLFRVRGIRSYPAERRAKEIENRIIEMAKDSSISPETITWVPKDVTTDIMAGDKRIMSVFDEDAKLEGVGTPVMARAITLMTRETIKNYREDRKPEKIRRGIFFSIGATALFIIILLLFHWTFGKIGKILKNQQERKREKIIKLKSMELIEADRFWKGVAGFVGGLHILIIFIIFYIFLEYVLSQFPWTRFIATRLLSLVADPLKTMGQAIIDYIPSFIFLIILTIVVGLFLKFLKTIFNSIERGAFSFPGFESEWARPTYRLLRVAIIALSVVIAYPYIPGSQSNAFKGVSLFMGLLLSLGSSSAIANVIAGYSLIYRRAFKVGDRIQIGEVLGDVTEIRLLVTHLLTIKNEEVTVPNSLILNSHVINYSILARTGGLILHTTVGIGYEVPWRQVEAMLIRSAERTAGLLKDPAPFVLLKSLGDFAVNYEINAYCDDAHRMFQIYAELHRHILDEFNEYGVQIMTPAYVGDPESAKTVAKEKWFAPPALGKEPG